ncbi:SH3 domain-containing protein [Sporosarcina sp. Te-1]|uniref:SH3 domain-containing protein n=1 Tax=Sporosarcina sp. Te-1 TaxID=2818390 RepID=UPI001A9F112F|nr:SH3 domain-containing protein [Sporosarcina sp. Te-1]QTD41611.1 SH3 domain-containing protein [Sporosarcina sp. Te-1]
MIRRRIGFLAIIFSILLGTTLTGVYAKGNSAVINTDSINVRSGPGLSYPVIGSLKKGKEVEFLSTSDDWLEIEWNGQSGWIASWLTSQDHSETITPKTIVSKVNSLNIRTSPSIGSSILGKMNAGEEATKTGQEGEWISITFRGIEGWVHNEYITEIDTAQVETTTPTVEKESEGHYFTVTVDALHVRKKADQSSRKIGMVHKGETYTVKEMDGNWVKINFSKKKEGWVYSFHGTFTEEGNKQSAAQPELDQVTVLTNGTNIRSQATTSSEVVHRANAGDKLPIISTEGEWYKIALPDGQEAFVAKWVVSDDSNATMINAEKKKNQAREPGTLKGLTIAIDAGHGGNDRGTTGARGTDEKILTLLTAELLESKLKAAGANVIMTRDTDTYVSLRKRVSIGHQHAVDAFVSLHYDANPDSSITGFTTYYTKSTQKGLAESINKGLASTVPLRDRGVQPANYLVLRENMQEAILIELGFLSNPAEERILTTDVFREQATYGIYQGLLDYFDSK